MKNSFFSKLARTFSSLGSTLGILLLCVCLAAAFVWPLWFWATNYSNSYTICVVVCVCAVFVWQIFRLAKKSAPQKVAIMFAKIAVAVAGISAAVFLVLGGKRLFALCAAAVCVFLEQMIGKIGKKRNAQK